MNIKFLEDCYNDKDSQYYLVEAFEVPCVIRVPTLINSKRNRIGFGKLNVLHLLDVRGLLECPIDGNYFVKYAFAQTGITMGSIEQFTKLEDGVLKDFLKLFNKDEDYYFYRSIVLKLNEAINKKR